MPGCTWYNYFLSSQFNSRNTFLRILTGRLGELRWGIWLAFNCVALISLQLSLLLMKREVRDAINYSKKSKGEVATNWNFQSSFIPSIGAPFLSLALLHMESTLYLSILRRNSTVSAFSCRTLCCVFYHFWGDLSISITADNGLGYMNPLFFYIGKEYSCSETEFDGSNDYIQKMGAKLVYLIR